MWRWLGLVGTVIIGFLACIGAGTASAKDIRFIAQEPVPDQLSWTPSKVTIDQKNDLKEPLNFILENSTRVDHEFAIHGLYEEISEYQTSPRFGEYYTGPKTVKV